jgi:hypothetical protein
MPSFDSITFDGKFPGFAICSSVKISFEAENY